MSCITNTKNNISLINDFLQTIANTNGLCDEQLRAFKDKHNAISTKIVNKEAHNLLELVNASI